MDDFSKIYYSLLHFEILKIEKIAEEWHIVVKPRPEEQEETENDSNK